ncbi:MAG TPA: Sua5/YciO/YrdC/YwlC family protein, partial [Usitatibacter sp.]|nr:Sua5/YciO/YrdC/YwlC family protein [Usitatibacter sp.]
MENALIKILVYAIPVIFAITLHEAAHGQALNDPQDIRRSLEHVLDLVIDSGPCEGEVTTVVDLSGEAPRLVRE